IIWVSYDPWGGMAFPQKEIPGRLEGLRFICPNPMKSAGQYERDKFSPRCRDNVLYRRWLVLEWDTKPEKDGKPTFWSPLIAEWSSAGLTTADAQTRLIAEMFGREFGLGMVVHSGNESLHSWWAAASHDEAKVEHFI